eukprot:scaffold1431_cov346-Pavlova_lutheri.AAC.38
MTKDPLRLYSVDCSDFSCSRTFISASCSDSSDSKNSTKYFLVVPWFRFLSFFTRVHVGAVACGSDGWLVEITCTLVDSASTARYARIHVQRTIPPICRSTIAPPLPFLRRKPPAIRSVCEGGRMEQNEAQGTYLGSATTSQSLPPPIPFPPRSSSAAPDGLGSGCPNRIVGHLSNRSRGSTQVWKLGMRVFHPKEAPQEDGTGSTLSSAARGSCHDPPRGDGRTIARAPPSPACERRAGGPPRLAMTYPCFDQMAANGTCSRSKAAT